MDYKSTMHIEFQGHTFTINQRLRDRLEKATSRILEYAALEDGLDRDAYAGDRETVKGWESENVGVSRMAEEERINDMIADLESRYPGQRFRRRIQGTVSPW